MKQIESYRDSLCNVMHFEKGVDYTLLMFMNLYTEEERTSLSFNKLVTDLSIIDLTLELFIKDLEEKIDKLESLVYDEIDLINLISELTNYEDIKPIQDLFILNEQNQKKLIEDIEYYLWRTFLFFYFFILFIYCFIYI